MIKVGFILPSSEYLFDPFRGDPFTHLHILTILESRLGSNVDAHLIDLRGVKREFEIQHIPECDVYLHSVYTLDFDEQKTIVFKLREQYPKAVHIAGGPHANSFQEECSKIFEALILGEGEENIVQAMDDFQNQNLQKIYQQTSHIDINNYPYWRRKFLSKSAVLKTNFMTLKRKEGYDKLLATTAMFSRGCPYQCHFCAMDFARKDNPGIRYRRPDLVEEEIEYLKKEYSVQGLSLTDEIGIPLNPKSAVPHLEAIGRTGIIWRGQCRVDGITPELAKLARESGCIALGMGVESVSQRSLDIINKKIRVERAKQTIALLKENGIEARIYVIIGLPGEPVDIVDQTWSFIEEVEPDLVYLSLFTIRPGTEVFNHPEKFGIKTINTDWTKTMHMYGRHSDETPALTFEYHEQTPWGQSIPGDQIVKNYLELQRRLWEKNLAHL